MSCINREKIRYAVRTCLDDSIDSFVIYPYGKKGRLVKNILNEEFGIIETAIVDNKLSNIDDNILSLDDLGKISKACAILLASDNKEIWNEIREELGNKFNGRIVDIANINVNVKTLEFTFLEEKLKIDVCSEEQRKKIFEKTMMVWEKLGEEEPYWSVLTSDEYKAKNLNEDSIKKFYDTGRIQTSCIGATLIRNGIINKLKETENLDIVEIGCGCGRITKSLAKNFRKVVAVDISKGNLEIAKQHIMDKNVEFRQISKVEDYNHLPVTDVVYSIIVLQHNCPPVIEYIIDTMFGKLKDSGIAIFQVPTYKNGYTFEYKKYVEEMMGCGLEMHLLPQKRIFELAYKNHCIPMEVYPDNSTGNVDNSTVFVFKKQDNINNF